MTRTDTVERIAQLVGDRSLVLGDLRDGWPALANVETEQGSTAVALFAGQIGLTKRGRDDVERRFQNPSSAKPIAIPPGRLPLLAGLWEQDPLLDVPWPVLAIANAVQREGRETRFSVFVRLTDLQAASAEGWSQGFNSTGEQIFCVHPALLPVLVEAVANRVSLDEDAVRIAVRAAGIGDLGDLPPDEHMQAEEDAAERVRRSTSPLVRNARFSRDVIKAYEGLCALCGLDLGLVQGAHILPVAAPASPDAVWNGVALCGNHHAAFDRHLIWLDPETRDAMLHPDLMKHAQATSAGNAFVTAMEARLREPSHPRLRPRADMFQARYEYYSTRYDWIRAT